MAALVEEMLGSGMIGSKEVHYNTILVDLAGNYMDKVGLMHINALDYN